MIQTSALRPLLMQMLYICLMIGLAAGVYALIRNNLLFSALILFFLLVATAVRLYRTQTRQMQQQYYEILLNKVETAVLVTDMRGHIEWMNRAALLQLGETPQLTTQLTPFLTGETAVLRIPQGNRTLEMVADSTIFVARRQEHRLITLKNIHSVLERNEVEAWQKLIRVLTHEIMNSITPIISLSETLSDRQTDYAVMQQAMQTIQRRSRGLLDFVENYRRLTRLPEPVPTDVSLTELLADMQKLFPQPAVRIELPIPDRTVRIDRGQIEQVLINLLKNALEATARTEQPRIELRTSFTVSGMQQHCTITVRDNGEGILPDVQDKIFVPFFTTKPSGSGIGLSLCKQIMNRHGGSISVYSEIGKGSCFTLQFHPIKPFTE
ncbi:MAG: HAMP domain-containing histidine kinase [Prevotellaceae bacterium]|jgi:signal transduction histidine kinase|nr:HAMP domain-containing histidine kinase [Prevotellaceae bacterium]